MTALQLYAFVVLPLTVAAIGYGGPWFYVRNEKRRNRLHPGE